MNKWEQNPYVRKHVHRWELTKKTTAVAAGFSWGGFGQSGWHDAEPTKLTRRCADCNVKQSASVPDESVLVPGYENIADVEWKDEAK